MRREREQKVLEIQEFRYSIVAELANPYLPRGEIKRLIREKAKLTYDIPYSEKKKVSEHCIKRWYKRFKKYGKAGLLPVERSDVGKSRVLNEEESDIIIKMLEAKPELTAAAVVRKLQKEGRLTKRVTKSTLSRLVIASGLDRKNRIKCASEEKNLKFDFFYPLECVQADCMHAFPIPDGKGKKRKAILLSFIDDATRRILYANFSHTECSLEFEKGIKHILKAHGKIGMLYCDNASTFISHQTKRILDILGIYIAHSRPGRPCGRGKKERFYRTFREQFLRPLDKESIKSLAFINTKMHTWIETEYHRTPHRGLLNKTPLDVWLEKAKYIISVDPTIDIDQVFLHEIKRKVYKDNTFTLKGTLFEVPANLAGNTVKILYDPNLPFIRPFIYHEGKLCGEAKPVDTYANTKVARNVITKGSYTPSTLPEIEDKQNISSSLKASLAASKINIDEKEEG
jgi:putative transposase